MWSSLLWQWQAYSEPEQSGNNGGHRHKRRFLGISVLDAELWEAYYGLLYAWESVQIQHTKCNQNTVVDALVKSTNVESLEPILYTTPPSWLNALLLGEVNHH
ncbi:hypothetical protein V6N12_019111 [Hibiscus sabdariffa]|uniref:RNase H type-1 domain-containing protein n=1 Tax=Hibiscus sabdariffa TaxID=183260 RepID=A0ABR2BA01_9ROSI